MAKLYSKKAGVTMFLLMVAMGFGSLKPGFQGSSSELMVVVLDIGQGDAIYIRTPEGIDILIDGGPDRSLVPAMSRHIPKDDRQIDYLIMTHPHADHYFGWFEVLERFEVGAVVMTGVEYESEAVETFQLAIRELGIPARGGTAFGGRGLGVEGQDLLWEEDDLRLEVLFPSSSIEGVVFEDINEASIVLKLTYFDQEFLFMGDAGFPVEAELVQTHEDEITEIEFLKVGHHGSKYASSDVFLELVSPKLALISAGFDNRFHHPHSALLRRLEKHYVSWLVTSEVGDIVIRCTVGECWYDE